MRRNIFLLVSLLFVATSYSQAVFKEISGTVTDGFQPLENVSITVLDSDKGVKTNAEGKYAIDAEEGQTLVYSYVGKQTIEIIVEDVTQFLNVELFDKVNELDEVVVTKKRRKTQQDLLIEYNDNKNLIKTGFGIIDKEKSGYKMRIIDGDDLSLAGRDFVDGLQSMLPGIQVFRPNALNASNGSRLRTTRIPTDLTAPIVFLQRSLRSMITPVPVAFEVDGVVYREAPTFIPITNIERIAVIESFAGLARYGSLGVGGMIIINTKTANSSPKEPGTNAPYDEAKLRDNFFEKGSTVASSESVMPTYLKALQNANGKAKAKEVFSVLEKSFSSSPHFYLDALSFFDQEYPEKSFSEKIANTLEDRFENNPNVLKALAYKLDEAGDFKRSNELYKKIFILRPHYSQSYLDLANSYRNLKKGDNAATLLARYNYLKNAGFFGDSETFSKILTRDFNNLLDQNVVAVNEKKIVKTNEDDFNGTRLVFEWNDSEAEFELQFVNPKGQYHTWKHSFKDSPERIKEGKTNGFSCEEYLIYEPQNGSWDVNVKYLGNKSLTSSYLKATIYYNYNTEAQRKEIKVFKLNSKNVNQALFSVNNNRPVQVH